MFKLTSKFVSAVTIGFIWVASTYSLSALADAQSHPNLTITQSDVANIAKQIKKVPSAHAELNRLITKVDQLIAQPMDVPVPKDAGGGYTHSQHKRNYQLLYEAGLLFQITKDQRYADFARTMLLAYADMYPTLGKHPEEKDQSPGILFWQSLNEAMWLVYTIQAYDMFVSAFNEADRAKIESQLLRPIAHYLSAGQPETFNKIHNHGTWAAAAVGMTGYVLHDPKLVKQALYGLDLSGKGGFLQQINQLFSPDGYYAEGPYYQRFALMPFVLFAKAIEANDPDLNIFEFRDQVLLKAIRTTVNLSYNTLFFGINDAIKDKATNTVELVHAIAIAYDITKDPTLLSVAQRQNYPLLTGYGFTVLRAIDDGLAKPFDFASMQLGDGVDGDFGALTIFRSGKQAGHQALVMKNTSQGQGHGHFDKLSWLYFDAGNEIVSDYGAARFLNVEAKNGGHYLAENNKWAKQTIAHNTLVVDEESHFAADADVAELHAPSVLFFDANDNVKVTTSAIDTAYPGVQLVRTMAMLNVAGLEHPLVVDVFKVVGESKHQYDLPLHFQGHIMAHNMALKPNTKSLGVLGTNNGYQYLWDRGRAPLESSIAQLTWLKDNRFYTYSTLTNKGEEMIFAQLGANDPNFNLRSESLLIHRVENAKEHLFVSALETHGEYNSHIEFTRNSDSSIADIAASTSNRASVVTITLLDGSTVTLAVAYDGDANTVHQINHKEQTIEWQGHYAVFSSASPQLK